MVQFKFVYDFEKPIVELEKKIEEMVRKGSSWPGIRKDLPVCIILT